MKVKTLIVVSDTHIGAGELDGFSEEIENHFCDFLKMLGEKSSPVELIINGDFLEFIQAPPWEGSELESKTSDEIPIPLCFTEEQSIAKLEAIHSAHENTFCAIKEFLKSNSENMLTIIPGNHDADFFWKRVREKFTEKVCDNETNLINQINFHLEQVYRPGSCPNIWIEHGHQYDPVNSFFLGGFPIWSKDIPPIFKDDNDVCRLYECAGTRFLIKSLNKLNKKYRFIKNVKPLSRFLSIFGASAFHPRHGPIRALAAICNFLKYLGTVSLKDSSDILEVPRSLDPRIVLADLMSNMTSSEIKDLQNGLKNLGFSLSQPLSMYLKSFDNSVKFLDFIYDKEDVLRILEDIDLGNNSLNFKESDQTLSFGKYAYTYKFKKGFRHRVNEISKASGVDFVIMGHTHEVDIDSYYYNLGSWTRNYEGDEGITPWKILKKDSFDLFPYELNYSKVSVGKKLDARFRTFGSRNHDELRE